MAVDPEEEFVSLLTEHHQRLLRFVHTLVPNRADAEDIFQKATVALWRKQDEFDSGRPFYPWACRFLHFEVMNYRKRAARDRLTFSEELIDLLAAEQVSLQPELEDRRAALDHCLEKLTEKEGAILERRYGESKSVASLASELKLTPKQLYKKLESIRRQLALCIDQQLPFSS